MASIDALSFAFHKYKNWLIGKNPCKTGLWYTYSATVLPSYCTIKLASESGNFKVYLFSNVFKSFAEIGDLKS